MEVLELAATAPTAPGSLLDWSSLVASFFGETGSAAKGLMAALRAPSTQEYGQGPTANVACSMQRPEYLTIHVVSVTNNAGLQGSWDQKSSCSTSTLEIRGEDFLPQFQPRATSGCHANAFFPQGR